MRWIFKDGLGLAISSRYLVYISLLSDIVPTLRTGNLLVAFLCLSPLIPLGQIGPMVLNLILIIIIDLSTELFQTPTKLMTRKSICVVVNLIVQHNCALL